MKKKRRGIFAQAKLKEEIFSLYSLKQVCETLNGYIDGGVSIRCEPSYAYINDSGLIKKETHGFKPLCPTDELIASIGYIGHKILLKFSKGEIPHPGRLAVGAVCLQIADKLEGDGKLPVRAMERLIAGQHSFLCRTYRTKSVGDIRIPELPGERLGSEGAAGGVRYDTDTYRQLVSKKTATMVIKAAYGVIWRENGLYVYPDATMRKTLRG